MKTQSLNLGKRDGTETKMAGRGETSSMSDSHYGKVAKVFRRNSTNSELERIYLHEEARHKKETEQENKKKDSPLWRKILLFWR